MTSSGKCKLKRIDVFLASESLTTISKQVHKMGKCGLAAALLCDQDDTGGDKLNLQYAEGICNIELSLSSGSINSVLEHICSVDMCDDATSLPQVVDKCTDTGTATEAADLEMTVTNETADDNVGNAASSSSSMVELTELLPFPILESNCDMDCMLTQKNKFQDINMSSDTTDAGHSISVVPTLSLSIDDDILAKFCGQLNDSESGLRSSDNFRSSLGGVSAAGNAQLGASLGTGNTSAGSTPDLMDQGAQFVSDTEAGLTAEPQEGRQEREIEKEEPGGPSRHYELDHSYYRARKEIDKCSKCSIKIPRTDNYFRCMFCEKCFISYSALRTHKRRHRGPKPYKCTHCGRMCGSSTTLQTHMSVHPGHKHDKANSASKVLKCSQCGHSFYSSQRLAQHQRSHIGGEPFKCPYCVECFTSAPELLKHKKETHSEQKGRLYKCAFCDKLFSHYTYRTYHERRHTGETPFKCLDCGKGFTRRNFLTEHMKTHQRWSNSNM